MKGQGTKSIARIKTPKAYEGLLTGVVDLPEQARRASARSVNAIMTATYWEIGRRIVEFEQRGASRASYGASMLKHLSQDLSARFGRGFSEENLRIMRLFYLGYRERISQTPSGKLPPVPSRSKSQTTSGESLHHEVQVAPEFSQTPSAKSRPTQILQTMSAELSTPTLRFPLPWSHYARLLSVENPEARAFYEAEALRGGWSVRQLDRQISTLFYERTALSRNKAAMLRKGSRAKSGETSTPEEEVKDPLVLEFLGLKDEYSENALEEALIRHLEHFLLELGNDFAFVARQKRLRVGDEWYRIDLLFHHRRLRCLIIIDLKIGKFTHADAGQMNLYLNYAQEHWAHSGESPPVGLILCARGDEAVAHYALGNLRNKVLAREYRLALPDEKLLVAEMEKTRRAMDRGRIGRG